MKKLRRKRRKPPRARPRLLVEGFTAAQLGAKVGVSARTVRYYTAQHVLPAAEFRGRSTRYLRQHLVHLAAIRNLQRDRTLSLDTIRARLAGVSAAELEQLAANLLPELALPDASVALPNAAPKAEWVSSKWQRVTVMPGVEVHLQEGAGDVAREIANELAKSAQRRWQEWLHGEGQRSDEHAALPR